MHALRKKRLKKLSLILLGVSVSVGLILFALQQNINLFYTPTQLTNGEAPTTRTIRVGGMVVANSVQREKDSLEVKFALTDTAEKIWVSYKGILPDLFREGQGIIAQGKFKEDKIFHARQVLAKHDENYMPPEVAEMMKQ